MRKITCKDNKDIHKRGTNRLPFVVSNFFAFARDIGCSTGSALQGDAAGCRINFLHTYWYLSAHLLQHTDRIVRKDRCDNMRYMFFFTWTHDISGDNKIK